MLESFYAPKVRHLADDEWILGELIVPILEAKIHK